MVDAETTQLSALMSSATGGEAVPVLLADRTYSGKFMVRVPPQTHRALAIKAAEEGVSLNWLASARLAE